MFSVPLEKLSANDAVPFPLYIFLPTNDRFILVRSPGESIGSRQYEQFLQKQLLELWVPNSFQEIVQNYIEYREKGKNPATDKRAPENEPEATTVAEPKELKTEDTASVVDALRDQELTRKEKADILSTLSQDLLRALNQITTRGSEARSEGLKRCKEITDEILVIAAKESNIYDEILALRSSKENIEHSVLVGTMAAMFGMALGYTDETLLADLTVSAIFHDIGLVRVKSEIMTKKEQNWTEAERQEYQKHVGYSLEILKESQAGFHPRVFRMILEHHECYDGSGFPHGLKGGEISEASAVLHLANLFDRLCTGKQTGIELSPSEAFDKIYEYTGQNAGRVEVQPELVGRIFQFMLSEKNAAAQLAEEKNLSVSEKRALP